MGRLVDRLQQKQDLLHITYFVSAVSLNKFMLNGFHGIYRFSPIWKPTVEINAKTSRIDLFFQKWTFSTATHLCDVFVFVVSSRE